MDTTDQPNSICHVQPIQMYQMPPSDPALSMPFNTLRGEFVTHHGRTVDGLVVLTNYRLYLQVGDSHHHLPLGLIESVEHRELFYLHIGCKDARTYRCIFVNNEACLEWFEKISKAFEPPKQLDQFFAFYHFIWTKHSGGDGVKERINNLSQYTFDHRLFKEEMERQQFEGASWRISDANKNYKLCPSYPPYLIVPSCINDETLESVAKFRSSRRIPAVVWRHTGNGAVIARSSQPEVGWLGWRSSEDEDLIKSISEACSFGQRIEKELNLSHSPGSLHSEDSLQITTEIGAKEKKVLIIDARSYTTAVANRARGGGCECTEYYPNIEIQFMNLANIHSIRKSFNALRLLCATSADQPNWFSQLEGTRWLQHMSVLMKAAVTAVGAIEREGRPVLVHCSDGWDRTPQIVALAELMLDPFYRTVEGFRILIEREWLAFGHKFADRCGHSTSDDANERCPVFLQWLDCVHQLLLQFDCAFEFSQSYLVKLAQHMYSNLYGTFLCNTFQERMKLVHGKTFSVWEFLDSDRFRNHLYASPGNSEPQVLWPQCNVRDLHFWHEVYLGSWEANSSTAGSSGTCPGPPESSSPSHMTKTRSYGDLLNAAADAAPNPTQQFRRSSDPSINIDKKLVVAMPQENGNNTATSSVSSVGGGVPSTPSAVAAPPPLANGGDFLCNGTDQVRCSRSNASNVTDEQRASARDEVRDVVINGVVKTDDDDDVSDEDDSRDVLLNGLFDEPTPSHRCDRVNGVDSDNEEATEKSESRSENTLCDLLGATERLETSTDTLVSDSHNISSSPLEVHGFEKLQSPDENVDTIDSYSLRAQNLPFFNGFTPRNGRTGPSAFFGVSPFISGPSSRNYYDNLMQHRPWHHTQLGDDGLLPVTSVAQERLCQIIQEHKWKEQRLEREVHTYRQRLMKQLCHKCNNNEAEKTDDAASVVESVDSAGESQASAVESLRSDMSWESLEENIILTQVPRTLWVPDHAVNSCTECKTEFWVGKRKHHCRSCGQIFCASCSENVLPLPSEQLFSPVRVCAGCYAKLRRDCGEIPDQCKQSNGQPTNSNPQITASSN